MRPRCTCLCLLLQINPTLAAHLTAKAMAHKCAYPYSAQALSIDGNQKVNRKVCASKKDIILKTDFNRVVYGCTNIPAAKSKFCAMHAPECSPQTAKATRAAAHEAAVARRVTRSMTKNDNVYELEAILARNTLPSVSYTWSHHSYAGLLWSSLIHRPLRSGHVAVGETVPRE